MASKNKPAAQAQKSQNSGKKDKKPKNESSGPPKAEIVVILTDGQAQKCIKGAKVITASDVAKQCGVKISAASVYLKSAAAEGKIKLVGGHSGHRIYSATS